jgi:hypothetical protein
MGIESRCTVPALALGASEFLSGAHIGFGVFATRGCARRNAH